MATHLTTGPRAAIHMTTARLASIGGAIFFALILVNAALRSGAPAASDSGRETLDYLTLHQGRFQLAAAALAFAVPAALIWLSGLYRVLRESDRTWAVTALCGGALAAATTVAGALIEGTVAARITDFGPSGAHIAWTMFLMSHGAMLLGLALITGATGVVCMRTELFSHGFGLTSLALALLSLAGAFTIGYASDPIQAVAGVAILLDSIWIFVVSFFLWRRADTTG